MHLYLFFVVKRVMENSNGLDNVVNAPASFRRQSAGHLAQAPVPLSAGSATTFRSNRAGSFGHHQQVNYKRMYHRRIEHNVLKVQQVAVAVPLVLEGNQVAGHQTEAGVNFLV